MDTKKDDVSVSPPSSDWLQLPLSWESKPHAQQCFLDRDCVDEFHVPVVQADGTKSVRSVTMEVLYRALLALVFKSLK